MTNYATSFDAKNVQKTKFEAAEMILDLWNQQVGPWSNKLNILLNNTQHLLRNIACCLVMFSRGVVKHIKNFTEQALNVNQLVTH